jgi:hypothetical protein
MVPFEHGLRCDNVKSRFHFWAEKKDGGEESFSPGGEAELFVPERQ